jgi:hypothetical protein
MAEREDAAVTTPSPSSAARNLASGQSSEPFQRAKRTLLLACAAIAGGLAIAGSLERTTGGVLVLTGWLGAIFSLHRIGRTGPDAPPEPEDSAKTTLRKA